MTISEITLRRLRVCPTECAGRTAPDGAAVGLCGLRRERTLARQVAKDAIGSITSAIKE